MGRKKRTRILAVSDFHTGATTGLTPPDCNYDSPYHRTRRKELWKCFEKEIKRLQPIDVVIADGDLVHGPSKTTARNEEILINELDNQADVVKIIFKDYIKAPKGVLTMGTNWHVGDNARPVEQRIAESLGYEFHKILEEYAVAGKRFHVKHKIGGSNDGRTLGNMLSKEYEHVLRNHERHGVPTNMPDVLLRAHRHVFHFRGNEMYASFILPCLQTWGGNVASELTSVEYPTVGIMWFDIEGGHMTWNYKIWKLASHLEGR